MLRHNQGLPRIGINAVVMRVNTRAVAVEVDHTITPVVVDTVVQVW